MLNLCLVSIVLIFFLFSFSYKLSQGFLPIKLDGIYDKTRKRLRRNRTIILSQVVRRLDKEGNTSFFFSVFTINCSAVLTKNTGNCNTLFCNKHRGYKLISTIIFAS